MTKVSLYRFGAELGTFALGPEGASYSKDGDALYVPALRLAPNTVRALVAGQSLLALLTDVELLQDTEHLPSLWTWCWGDLQLFLNGEPIIKHVLLLRDMPVPDLKLVRRYLEEAPKTV